MKKIGKCLVSALLLLALLCACGTVPEQAETSDTPLQQETVAPVQKGETADKDAPNAPESETAEKDAPNVPESETAEKNDPDAPVEQAPPADTPESEDAEKEHTCTLSISCATILENKDKLTPGKETLLPEDGWVLAPTEVVFYEGESVFNVLQRTCKQQKIHLEFEDTPLYDATYIEGIHNLYEFDCGDLSGWTYKVNDWFPNYGCSRYALADGDVVCWEYTCDLGRDVNGYVSATQEG